MLLVKRFPHAGLFVTASKNISQHRVISRNFLANRSLQGDMAQGSGTMKEAVIHRPAVIIESPGKPSRRGDVGRGIRAGS